MGSVVRGSGRWKTLEFGIYYVIIAWFFCREVPSAFKNLSTLCYKVPYCEYHLWPSVWFPESYSWQIDLSDIQWRSLREALPLLCLAAAAHVALRAAFGRSQRKWPCLVLGLGFVGYVHGSHCLFHVAVCSVVFAITRLSDGALWGPFATWAFALTLMIWKHYGASKLTFTLLLGPTIGGPLDDVPRAYEWQESLNLLVLRLVSFSLDAHWARRDSKLSRVTDDPTDPTVSVSPKEPGDASRDLSYKAREREHRPLSEYSLVGCLAHGLYAPLWLAGPTISFNAFSSYISERPQDTYSTFWLGVYGLRWLFALGLLEAALHLIPVFAIGRSGVYKNLLQGSSAGADGAENAAMFVYIVLTVMYLKFLVIWRFARLWALCDGVECIENMQRCMNNNFSFIGFWRGWHCSFNRWLVRYLYVPLGGRRWRWANVWLVFSFVAFWHDAEIKLAAWGLLNAAFVAIEGAAHTAWRGQRLAALRQHTELARCIRAFGGTTYIFIMMFVNLVGYGVGLSNTSRLTGGLFADTGTLRVVGGAYVVLFAGVQVMLELRERGLCRSDTGSDKST